MSTLLAIVLVGAGSYALRSLPLLTGGRGLAGERTTHILDNAAAAAVIAVIVQDVIGAPSRSAGLAMVAALVAAGVLAVRHRSTGLIVVVGIAVYTVATHLPWAWS
jgi:branched-subunit amino acid transport protein